TDRARRGLARPHRHRELGALRPRIAAPAGESPGNRRRSSTRIRSAPTRWTVHRVARLWGPRAWVPDLLPPARSSVGRGAGFLPRALAPVKEEAQKPTDRPPSARRHAWRSRELASFDAAPSGRRRS